MPEKAREELSRAVSAVLAAVRAMPDAVTIAPELQQIANASERGYFLPDEDESVRLRYLQYLSARAALLEIPATLLDRSGRKD
jgi:hypothetical protein